MPRFVLNKDECINTLRRDVGRLLFSVFTLQNIYMVGIPKDFIDEISEYLLNKVLEHYNETQQEADSVTKNDGSRKPG